MEHKPEPARTEPKTWPRGKPLKWVLPWRERGLPAAPGNPKRVRAKRQPLEQPQVIPRRVKRKPQEPSKVVDIRVKGPPVKEQVIPIKTRSRTQRWRLWDPLSRKG